ncbi:MAG: GWxTD domain-containing protein [Bacteroidota bacterium]
MKRHYISILLVSLVISLLISCVSYKTPVRNSNVAFLYNPSSTPLHPECLVYHNADTTSTVFVRININELLFQQKERDQEPEALLKIHFKLLDSFLGNNIKDSATCLYSVDMKIQGEFLYIDFPVRAKKENQYLLDILIFDMNRGRGNQLFISIDKRDIFSQQNFLLIDVNGNPVFTRIIYPDSSYVLRHRDADGKTLKMRHYGKRFGTPAPPFSVSSIKTYSLKPDTTIRNLISDTICVKKYGLYFITLDTADTEGFSFLNFGPFFPEVKTAETLLEPMRYLTSIREMKEYYMFDSKKEAVDNFWMKSAGNINRARELIRVYYTRVKYANYYFTSYTEGWRTDRGMMYIIFGPPSTIYKNDSQERWIYGTTQSSHVMNFAFNKVKNIYSDNDFELYRSEIYKITWYQAIETWRDGRVFSIVK